MLRWSLRLVHWLVAGVFLLAGVLKLSDQHAFTRTISDFGIVPDVLVPFLALAIPIAELFAAALLIMQRRSGLTAITAMLVIYVGVVTYGLWLGLDIDCGCLGPTEKLWGGGTLWKTLVQDLILLAVCVFLWRCELPQD